MREPPLARYSDKLIEFTHELTPMRLSAREQEIFRQFQEGTRTGLGADAWGAVGLLRIIWLSGVVVTWKTLCFERQFTAIYGKNKKRALPWFNGFSHLIGDCDPMIRQYLRFGGGTPGVTVEGDEFWRLLVLNCTESDQEHVNKYVTNIIYYDFNRVPEWLVVDSQRAVKKRSRSVTFSINLERGRRDPEPMPDATYTDPPQYRDRDESADDDE